MKFSRVSRHEPKISFVTAMALFNALFIFLMFFLLSAFVVTPSGLSLTLPRGVTAQPLSSQGFSLTLLKDNSIYLAGRPVTLTELKKILSASSFFVQKNGQERPHVSVLIKADRQASVGVLVRLWDIVREAGADKVYIATNE